MVMSGWDAICCERLESVCTTWTVGGGGVGVVGVVLVAVVVGGGVVVVAVVVVAGGGGAQLWIETSTWWSSVAMAAAWAPSPLILVAASRSSVFSALFVTLCGPPLSRAISAYSAMAA